MRRFLLKFKTLAILTLVFFALGLWILPKYHTYAYQADDVLQDFWVLEQSYGKPFLLHIRDAAPHHNFWVQAVDFEETPQNAHVHFLPITQQGKMHYELQLVSNIQTTTFAYVIENQTPKALYWQVSGLIVWMQALGITVAFAVLILILQVVLGVSRSLMVSPKSKKKLQKYQHK